MAVLELPWSAWYEDAIHRLDAPDDWLLDNLAPAGGRQLSVREIEEQLRTPVGVKPLEELASECRSACIAVDDLARPTRVAEIIPGLVRQLREGNINDGAIRIVVATGSHPPLSQQELAWKLGRQTCSAFPIECHDSRGELLPTGIKYGDQELRINRTFMEADLKLAIGSVLPHAFAGFSGGAKLVLPGLADLNSIQRSHKFVQLGLRGGADPNENRFRLEAEKIAGSLGLAFVVCAVTDSNRDTIGVHAGDVTLAHRQACLHAGEAFATDLHKTYDAAFVNAFPKDIDLIQAESAFVAWKSSKAPVVRAGGVVVLTSAASTGLGRHGLFEPGGASYRPPQPKRWLKDRELWLYVPNVSVEDVRRMYWDGYPVYQDGAELMQALEDRLPRQAHVAVFPCGPMQCLRDFRDSLTN